jgi:copper chaperone CopZ/F0F1-type ATP synthase membrane subunit c/vacuolar-type H+-ATPase subunit K
MKAAACGLALALAAALPAAACGICIEDRVAAVYDQPTVDRAVARHQQVAFFALQGSVEATPDTRRAVTAALERGGVRGTVHVSLASETASVAFDPKRASVASIAAAGDRALAPKGLTLGVLRVIGADGKLQQP